MARSDTFQFVHVTRIVAGPGTSDQAGDELRAVGATRAIIVTDRGIAASGILGKLEPGLKRAQIAYDIFDEIEPNPAAAAVERAAEQARAAGADAVLAVGGGSPIDAGKMVAVLAKFAGAVRDYEGINTIAEPTLPLVAIPTSTSFASAREFRRANRNCRLSGCLSKRASKSGSPLSCATSLVTRT